MPMNRRAFGKTLLGAFAAGSAPPNVVLFFMDDLGYGDLGCYGGFIRTPNIDRMAREGMRFTACDSANPLCSPSRASLLTGRYNTRTGVPRVLNPKSEDGLNTDETTLANLLKTTGHRTMCIGKWHLGTRPQYLPTARGFDRYFGIPYSNDMNPRVLMRDAEVIEKEAPLDTLTGRYTQTATQFIDECGKAPFFLYFPHTYPHIPLGASKRFRGKSPLGIYGDVVEELDWSVGEVLGALRRNGVERRTMVILSSDNGPWYQGSPGRLRGRKGTTWEGGVREPFLVRWPGAVPAGRVCHAAISTMDVFPTVAHACGAKLPAKPLDGIDIWPLLTGAKQDLERQTLLYFQNIYLECGRWKNWKLHVSRANTLKWSPAPPGGVVQLMLPKPELYDLSMDPDESYDVADEHPGIVRRMLAEMEAAMQTFPPDIRKAWDEIKARKAAPLEAGNVPRPA
ncbi:MAG: sulfatase [Bryobacteraceae bacterium]